ncbi:transformer-2 protein homolog alpha isoform X2 [Neocloeon triangulifer]|uniref:transformer-2 protein homolog alpha isoform X2 n=1 Tax=Neocloeon triangulifer TaxID=2078957 RepID=UPI00286EB81A|nr:transformer-2 protein homolog alpha isoform X2 [Neocloeon triangulifer]
MSDREHSPARSGSYRSADLDKHVVHSPHRARLSRSPSPARLEVRRNSFSRSSPSNKRKMSFRGERSDRGERGERGRYRSRSRSRSPRRAREYSRSRSRSRSRRRDRDGIMRSHSRSPMSNRRRHIGNRDQPNESRCVGVFGLSIYTTEHELSSIFSKYGPVERVQVVIDAKTGRSRGFAFVYYTSKEDAKVAKDRCSGMEIDGRRIRVDFSITQRAHTPTPGIYMGKPTEVHSRGRSPERERWGGSGRRPRHDGNDAYGGERYRERYRRSPSPYYSSRSRKGRYERSRSRSYSPRIESRGNG